MSVVYTPPVKAKKEYLERMRKSFPDKAWFVPLLKSQHNIKSIVDFGCADGSFIKFLEKRLLNVRPDIVPHIVGADMERRLRSAVGEIWMPGGKGQITGRLRDFKKHWGSVADGYKAVHFLLKYFYEENWDRELPENYLSVDWKWLYGEIRNMGGDVTYMKNYCLPYLLRKWRKDFGDQRLYDWFGLIKTHVKMFVTFPQEN